MVEKVCCVSTVFYVLTVYPSGTRARILITNVRSQHRDGRRRHINFETQHETTNDIATFLPSFLQHTKLPVARARVSGGSPC